MTAATWMGLALLFWVLGSFAGRHGPLGLAILGTIATAPYWLGPILIWRTNRSRVPRWSLPEGQGLDAVPRDLRPFFDETDHGFVALGFSLVAVMTEEDLAPGYTTWVALYVHRTRRERAVAHAHVSAKMPIKPKPSFYCITNFTDGRFVETANSDHITPFPTVPGKDSRQFPEVGDPGLLHRIHETRSAAFGGAARDLPAAGAEVEFLTQAMVQFYELQVGTGYLRVVEQGRLFRPTAKGAALMTWRLLPPMTWIARSRRARRNREFLEEHHLLPPHA